MKNYLILSALLAFVPAAAQTSLGDYRQAVTEYSWELKVAASKSDAASETMGQARTGYLPRLSLDGSFTATVHHYDGVERWNFSVLPQLVQTVYGGGAVRAAYNRPSWATTSPSATRSSRSSTCVMRPSIPTGTSPPWSCMPHPCASMST